MKDRIRAAFTEIRADETLINSTSAYIKISKRPRRKTKRFGFSAGALAAAFALILIAGVFSRRLYFTAAAYISIDVNPSVELTLNRLDKVIATHAFNTDGAKVLSGLNLRGMTYDEAAGVLLSAIEADGYMAEDALISVTVQSSDSEKEQKLCDDLLSFINENILPSKTSAEVEVFTVTPEVWADAHNCHISPASFLAIQELLEVNTSAVMEDYKDTPIRQIRQHTQECRSGHTEPSKNNTDPYPQNDQESEEEKIYGHGHNHKGDHK